MAFFFPLLPEACIEAESTYSFRDLDAKERNALKKYLRSAGEKRRIEKEAEVTGSRGSSAVPGEVNEETDDGPHDMSQPQIFGDSPPMYDSGNLISMERNETPSPVDSEQDGIKKRKNPKKRSHGEDDDDDEYTDGPRAKRVRHTGKAMDPRMMPAISQIVTERSRHFRPGGSRMTKTAS